MRQRSGCVYSLRWLNRTFLWSATSSLVTPTNIVSIQHSTVARSTREQCYSTVPSDLPRRNTSGMTLRTSQRFLRPGASLYLRTVLPTYSWPYVCGRSPVSSTIPRNQGLLPPGRAHHSRTATSRQTPKNLRFCVQGFRRPATFFLSND